ncbi:hypothetical protein D3C85_1423410 [compost metagenome]
MPLAIADEFEAGMLRSGRIDQVHLAKTRDDTHLKQQCGRARVPGTVDLIQALEWAVCNSRWQILGPRHMNAQ